MMKKLLALLMAVIMVMSLATTAFAAETGSITIAGAHDDYTYEIYKILSLESYSGTNYSYKVDPDWVAFFATPAAAAYFDVDEDGFVAEKEGSGLAANIVAFAQAALAYAKANSISPVKSTKNPGDATVTPDAPPATTSTIKFENLDLGYYLIDSDLGALCGLTTTNPNATVTAKNTPPKQDKQVQEDSTMQWGDSNTADIGQTVNFRVTIDVHAGAENYVLHDIMSEGLTFDADSVAVTLNGAPVTASDNYTVITSPAAHADTCKSCDEVHEACTFEVVFSDAFAKTLAKNDKLVVTYSAVVNEKAKIGDESDPNFSRLTFGEGYCTGWDRTDTYSFSFDLVKTDDKNVLIDGAVFELYDVEVGGNAIELIQIDEKNYRRAFKTDDPEKVVTKIVVKDGLVTVAGFDNGTYYLQETQTPAGYNKLDDRIDFTISDENLSAIFVEEVYAAESGVQVVNNSGTVLPGTGGMGTTLFYIFGGIFAMAAVVLLITKKRMVAEN